MIGIEVQASRELARLAVELKAAGDDDGRLLGFRHEVLRGLRAGSRPLINAGRAAARDRLPRRGGLNEWVASASFGVRTSLAGNPRVRIVATKKGPHDLKAIDEGVVRHPVFGNPKVWVEQKIAPHIITDAMEAEAPAVREELLTAIEAWARRLS